MGRRALLILVIFSFLFSFTSNFVFAHELTSAGSLEALLHIEPFDEPQPNQESMLHLTFSDASGKFSLNNCSCFATIFEKGQSIFSSSLNLDWEKTSTGYFSFIFPREDTYSLEIQGSPIIGKPFPDFKLNYAIEVTRLQQKPDQPKVNYLPLVLSLASFLLLVLFAFWENLKKIFRKLLYR